MSEVKLYLGDCLEIMPTLPQVDAIITDPPYEVEAHTPMRHTRSVIEGREEMAGMPFDPIDENTRRSLVDNCLRLSKGWALIFCQAEAVGKYRDLFGETWRRAMVWIKPDSSPQFTGDRPAMGYESICAAWCNGKQSAWNGGGRRGVFTFASTGYEHNHPAQKPVKLLTMLISLFTNPGDTILDPFAGSGTTGVAAILTGRNAILIEKDPAYFAIMQKRIHDAQQHKLLPWPGGQP